MTQPINPLNSNTLTANAQLANLSTLTRLMAETSAAGWNPSAANSWSNQVSSGWNLEGSMFTTLFSSLLANSGFAGSANTLSSTGLEAPSNLSTPTESQPLDLASLLLSSALSTTAGTANGITANPDIAPVSASVQSGANQNDTSQIDSAVRSAAGKYGLPQSLLQAVIHQESGGNPSAVSSAGAMGLMQLMPTTAKSLGVSNPFDISANVDAGSRYLAQLLQQFNGNLPLALAAYNAGPAAVTKYQGIPPYTETQRYVQDILAMMPTDTPAGSSQFTAQPNIQTT